MSKANPWWLQWLCACLLAATALLIETDCVPSGAGVADQKSAQRVEPTGDVAGLTGSACDTTAGRGLLLKDLGAVEVLRRQTAIEGLSDAGVAALEDFKTCRSLLSAATKTVFLQQVVSKLGPDVREAFLVSELNEALRAPLPNSFAMSWLAGSDAPFGYVSDIETLKRILLLEPFGSHPLIQPAAQRLLAIDRVSTLAWFDELIDSRENFNVLPGIAGFVAVQEPPDVTRVTLLMAEESQEINRALAHVAAVCGRRELPLLLLMLEHGSDELAQAANRRLRALAHMPQSLYPQEITSAAANQGVTAPATRPVESWRRWWQLHERDSDEELQRTMRSRVASLEATDPAQALQALLELGTRPKSWDSIAALAQRRETVSAAGRLLLNFAEAGDAEALAHLMRLCPLRPSAGCSICPALATMKCPAAEALQPYVLEAVEASKRDENCQAHFYGCVSSAAASRVIPSLLHAWLAENRWHAKAALLRAPNAYDVFPAALAALRDSRLDVRWRAYRLLQDLNTATTVDAHLPALQEVWQQHAEDGGEPAAMLLALLAKFPRLGFREAFATALTGASAVQRSCGALGLFRLGEQAQFDTLIAAPEASFHLCRLEPEDLDLVRDLPGAIARWLAIPDATRSRLWAIVVHSGGRAALDAVIGVWRGGDERQRTTLLPTLLSFLARKGSLVHAPRNVPLAVPTSVAARAFDGISKSSHTPWLVLVMDHKNSLLLTKGAAPRLVTVAGSDSRSRRAWPRLEAGVVTRNDVEIADPPRGPRIDGHLAIHQHSDLLVVDARFLNGGVSCLFERGAGEWKEAGCLLPYH